MPDTTKDPRPTSERVQQLANRVRMGDIALPEFQRPFVWSRKQIISLLDSVYRNYPIGSLLVWESRQELESKRKIADLEIQPRKETYPVNYLLDGQQRLNTVCGVLYWQPDAGDPRSVWNVVFDLRSESFVHLTSVDSRSANQLPLRWLASPSTFYRQVAHIEDESMKETANLLFNRFIDYQVPLVTLGDMSLADVGPVFERINSTGTKLTIFDLMRAATWSPEFDLGKTVQSVKDAVSAKGYSAIEQKTLLRGLAANGGGDFSAESIDSLRHMKSADLVAAADETREAAKRAVDFLATEIGAPRAEALPYANQFAVLCEIFRLVKTPTSTQLSEIKRWFWGTTISGYFAGWDNVQMAKDAQAVKTWADGSAALIDTRLVMPTPQVWSAKSFRTNSAVSKMLGLLLGQAQPVDLLNGQKLDVGKSLAWSNDKEYHHFFPKAYVKREKLGEDANRVANIILLTSSSNIKILDKRPSDYLSAIENAEGRAELVRRLKSNLVPEAALDAALADDYRGFMKTRGEYLHDVVRSMVPAIFEDGAESEGAVVADDHDDSIDGLFAGGVDD